MAAVQIDYYAVLGVERTATQADIKRAFREKVRSCHPDANPGDADAERRFKEINEAYSVLNNPEKRSNYDQWGTPEPGAGGFGSGGGLFGDLFDLFGGFGEAQQSGPRQGANLQMSLRITLEEAAKGTTRTVRIPRFEPCSDCDGTGAEAGTAPQPCPECGGTGQVRSRVNTLFGQSWSVFTCPRCGGTGKLIAHKCRSCGGTGKVRKTREQEIKIQPGVDRGVRLRVAGAGELGERGAPPGDLFILMDVADDPRFTRDGDELHCAARVSYPDAVFGTTLKVETLIDGLADVKIPAGTGPGSVVRLKGLGMPRLRSFGRGDLYVHVELEVPAGRELSAQAQEALKAFRQAISPDGPSEQEEKAEPSAKDKGDGESLLGKIFGGTKKRRSKKK